MFSSSGHNCHIAFFSKTSVGCGEGVVMVSVGWRASSTHLKPSVHRRFRGFVVRVKKKRGKLLHFLYRQETFFPFTERRAFSTGNYQAVITLVKHFRWRLHRDIGRIAPNLTIRLFQRATFLECALVYTNTITSEGDSEQ